MRDHKKLQPLKRGIGLPEGKPLEIPDGYKVTRIAIYEKGKRKLITEIITPSGEKKYCTQKPKEVVRMIKSGLI